MAENKKRRSAARFATFSYSERNGQESYIIVKFFEFVVNYILSERLCTDAKGRPWSTMTSQNGILKECFIGSATTRYANVGTSSEHLRLGHLDIFGLDPFLPILAASALFYSLSFFSLIFTAF